MRLVSAFVAAGILALCAFPAHAQNSTLTSAGYTGLGLTPNARILPWGQMQLAYEDQVPGVLPVNAVRNPGGHNYVLGFGLLPNLEIVGRIATNTVNDPCFAVACGIRDLSASAKVGIGLDAAGRFSAAAGIGDFGGSASNFRTYYGVVTYAEKDIEVNAGMAHRTINRANTRSPLHGPFVSAAWSPVSALRGHVEYVDSNVYAGLRLFAPKEWLPDGWGAFIGANARITDSEISKRAWFTAGLTIPLYKTPDLRRDAPRAPLPELAATQKPLPAYEARTLPPAPTSPPLATAPPVPAMPPADNDLQVLATALQERGLEDISVGRTPDGAVAVRANNATYNWNSLDALGVALGAVSKAIGNGKTAYRLVLTQRQMPLVAVTGQTDCLRQWIESNTPACAAGQLSTPGSSPLEELHDGAVWVVRDLQPSRHTLRVALSPVLRTNIATEVGVLDYSLGVNVGFGLPVWNGGAVEWRVNGEFARSGDYERAGVYYNRRIRNGTERFAFTQALRIPAERWFAPGDAATAHKWGLTGVTALATVGRIGSRFDGVHGSVRWEPGEGRHRVSLQAGYLRNSDFGAVPGEPETARPFLGTYRYNVAATRTYLEATGGQFMNNDQGLQLGLRQWFTDVSVQFYVRRTKFSNAARNFAGVELSVPIGPRRDMNPGGFQVTGTPRFSHTVETTVGGLNVVAPGFGVIPPAPSLDAVFNSDRASLLYFEDNIRRIRDAAR